MIPEGISAAAHSESHGTCRSLLCEVVPSDLSVVPRNANAEPFKDCQARHGSFNNPSLLSKSALAR